MAHKYFADQYEDEEVLMVFNKHPIVMRKGLIFGMSAIALGTIPSFIWVTFESLYLGLLGGLGLGLLVFFPSWIAWHFSVYIVTDQRFIQITQKGMFKRSVVDLALNQIQMVNYEINGFQETLLGFGTIMIQTFVGDLTIHDVHHPAKIQKELLLILRDQGINTNASNPKQQITDQKEDEEDEE
ncbi:MAG: PH domain-containing protein [bacterium]